MRFFLIILSIVFFSSCKKQDLTIENLNSNKIDVLGHAGSGIASLYPINSMESFLQCIADGATGTELDVQLTADDVLVAFHDEELDNSTNLSGRIRSKTWEEISEGYYDVVPMTSYHIIRVQDLMETYLTSDRLFTFDIKLLPLPNEDLQNYLTIYSQSISELFTTYNLYNQSFVESQSEDFIAELSLADGAINQFIYPQVFEDGLAIASTHGLYGITISNNNITQDQVKQAHDLGFRITIWDVHSKKENRDAVHKNPDMIQTDKIDYLVEYLN